MSLQNLSKVVRDTCRRRLFSTSAVVSNDSPMPLDGIRVLELAGLAPLPFAAMMLADQGADVLRIDRPVAQTEPLQAMIGPYLARHKRSISLDLRSDAGKDTLLNLVEKSDVFMDPYRPGVLEKWGVGPDVLFERNPEIILVRLTGYGQTGPMADLAGHDINYLATSGALHAMRRPREIDGGTGDSNRTAPVPPSIFMADFCGGSLMAVQGVLLALINRRPRQIIDAAMVDGCTYLGSMYSNLRHSLGWNPNAPGTNSLDGGAPYYRCYECKDEGQFMAVGSLEPQFYARMVKGLGLDQSELPMQMDTGSWPEVIKQFAEIFRTKTRDEWTEVFADLDACVTPVLTWEEAQQSEYSKARKIWYHDAEGSIPDPTVGSLPRPAPVLSSVPEPRPITNWVRENGEHAEDVLKDWEVPEELHAQVLEWSGKQSK